MKTRVQPLIYIFLIFIGGFFVPINATERSSASNNVATDSIYQTVDQVPVFKKSGNNIQKFLSKQIKYPVECFS